MAFVVTAGVLTFAETAAIGIAAVGAAASISAGKKAGKAGKRQAAEQARIEREVTTERVRQIDREQMLLGEDTKIRTAGSGISVGSKSTLEVLADQEAEFARERSITQRVGASAAKAALDQGNALATQAKFQGYSGALSGLSTIFSILGDK